MAKRKGKHYPPEHYDALKAASGWYLQAWRHHRNLTLEELAEEAGTSKGRISELESGKGARWNSDVADQMARALSTKAGRIVDVNPFLVDERFTQIEDGFERLNADDRQTVADLVKRLGGAA